MAGTNASGFKSISFPSDVESFQHHPNYVQIKIFKRISPTQQEEDCVINLSVPDNIRIDSSANWDSVRMGAGGQSVINNYRYKEQDIGAGFKEAASSVAKYVASAGLANFANVLGGDSTGADLLGAGAGIVLNPYMTAVFHGVNLREFNLTFSFYPRNPSECETLSKILKMLEMAYLPRQGSDLFYLGYPSEFEVEYRVPDGSGSTTKNPYIPNYKRCVLRNISVDYSGVGFFGTFRNGFPLETILSLTFSELEAKTVKDLALDTGFGNSMPGYVNEFITKATTPVDFKALANDIKDWATTPLF